MLLKFHNLFFLLFVTCGSFIGCSGAFVKSVPEDSPAVDEDLFEPEAKASMLNQLERTLSRLRERGGTNWYPRGPVTKERLECSLVRFKELLETSESIQEFDSSVQKEFIFYRSSDARGESVLFTGYYKPIFTGSLVADETFRFPLYGVPAGLKRPFPTRAELTSSGVLSGAELVYLADPLDAYLAQIQGSVAISLTDGSILHFGYADSNGYPYVSLGKELIADQKLQPTEASMGNIKSYFALHPEELQEYINRNHRFIFFRPSSGGALGSFGVDILGNRAIATDKSIYPAGGLVMYETLIPYRLSPDSWGVKKVRRYALDLDSGSAITGSRRVDIYFGEGEGAGEIAGRMRHFGSLFYLLLK